MSDILGSVKEMELKVFKENEMVQVDFFRNANWLCAAGYVKPVF